MNFDLSQGRVRVSCNAEAQFSGLQLACILRGFTFFRKEDEPLRAHLQKKVADKTWARAQVDAVGLEAPVEFWKSSKREFGDSAARLTAYKLWILSALSPGCDHGKATAFVDKLREIWNIPWLDGLSVTQAMLNVGTIKGLEDSILGPADRQLTLALISLLVHADGMMHITEVNVFRRCIELLEISSAELGFLKGFAETKAPDLAKNLGPQKFGAALPHLLRTVLADGLPRPSELAVLARAIEASGVPAAATNAAIHFAALERGVVLELS